MISLSTTYAVDLDPSAMASGGERLGGSRDRCRRGERNGSERHRRHAPLVAKVHHEAGRFVAQDHQIVPVGGRPNGSRGRIRPSWAVPVVTLQRCDWSHGM